MENPHTTPLKRTSLLIIELMHKFNILGFD